MINQVQAEQLLETCETYLKQRLGRLRKALRKNHSTTRGYLWELIVLHNFIALANKLSEQATNGYSSPLAFQVYPEQGEGMPDVGVCLNSGKSLWLEATHIDTQSFLGENGFRESLKKIERLKDFSKNPVYRTIQGKTQQAVRWYDNKMTNRTQDPLVLVICISQNLYQLKIQDRFSTIELEKPVYSALADNGWWNISRIMRYSNDRSWPWNRKSQQVPGSQCISAVLVVPLRTEFQALPFKAARRADPILIENPSARVPLSEDFEGILRLLDFNQVTYSTSRENWENWEDGQEEAPTALERYRREAYWNNSFQYGFLSEGAFEIAISTKLIVRLIAEDVDTNRVWADLLDSVYNNLKFAALSSQQISSIAYIQPSAEKDDMSYLKIRFSQLKKLANQKSSLYSHYSMSSENVLSSVELSANAFISLLTGNLPPDVAWQDVNKQKLNDVLVEAMSNAQDITSASVVPFVEDTTGQKIILNFGAAAKPTIRELKKSRHS